MRYLLILLVGCFSLQLWGQSFKMTNPRMVNFDVCQENHNIILNSFIAISDSQIKRLITGLDWEKKYYTPEFKIKAYENLLADILIKKIIYSQLKKQLNRQSLKAFFTNRNNISKDFLNDQSITVDLNTQIPAALKSLKNMTSKNFTEAKISRLSGNILQTAGSLALTKQFRQVGTGIYARLVTGQTGKVTSQMLKSATLSLGSRLFVSVSQGLILDILTIPLKGSRLPPEALWTDLLHEYPELIIVPEWMKRGGIKDHPWTTHCNAIQRSTEQMTTSFKRALKLEESSFLNRVGFINDELEEVKPKPKKPYLDYTHPVAVDNTYVKKPYIPPEVLLPSWAREL